jgi:hypothetical protein
MGKIALDRREGGSAVIKFTVNHQGTPTPKICFARSLVWTSHFHLGF